MARVVLETRRGQASAGVQRRGHDRTHPPPTEANWSRESTPDQRKPIAHILLHIQQAASPKAPMRERPDKTSRIAPGAPSPPRDVLADPLGQWAHQKSFAPHEETVQKGTTKRR
ncbi:hypothetical protein FRC01_014536, partial [Tulasnella sp. 417]